MYHTGGFFPLLNLPYSWFIMNKTKIVATIGPASNSEEVLKGLALAGASIFRLNFSHGSAKDFVDIIARIRKVEKEVGRPITIMQDLSGPKIRLGDIREKSIQAEAGMQLLLGPADKYCTDLPYLPFDHEVILESLMEHDRLVLADGGLEFIVTGRRPDGLVILEAKNSGTITSRKGLALPGKSTRVRALTDKDKKDLVDGIALGIDAVAMSYVQTADDVREARELITANSARNIPICVKLERQAAVNNLPAILAETDIVMVARGDLGVECPLPKLPSIQKQIIRACNDATKPVIVATQMLLSMINSPSPTRAETTDVANAVLDGADCVMLSEETAMGKFPVETVRYMRNITNEAEELLIESRKIEEPDRRNIPSYLAYSACLLARKARAQAFVIHSLSGKSARKVANFRPQQKIFALTPDKSAVKYLNYSWGVIPVLVEDESPSHLDRAEDFIRDNPAFRPGDCCVITAGMHRDAGKITNKGTNLIKIFWK